LLATNGSKFKAAAKSSKNCLRTDFLLADSPSTKYINDKPVISKPIFYLLNEKNIPSD
jgi:hypothetical protein